jgi:hypothetical protein
VVPGTATLDQGGGAAIQSVSCASAGNCSAGGYYVVSVHNQQAFVVSEVNGSWQQAEGVPGTAALDQGGQASVDSVSCASAGNCSAGGGYTDGSGHQQAFVVSETSGTWLQAQQAPGTAALNLGSIPGAGIDSVSCGSAGNCAAGGSYTDSAGHRQAFLVSEVSGDWRQAVEVPGTAALNQGGDAGIYSVSCASAGNCSAGGGYTDGSGHPQAFVVSEVSGTWEQAQEVPGTAALNLGTLPGAGVDEGASAGVDSVSCASAGDCSAGGNYVDVSSQQQVFVVSET